MAPFKVPQGPHTIEKVMESIRQQVIEPNGQAVPNGDSMVQKTETEKTLLAVEIQLIHYW